MPLQKVIAVQMYTVRDFIKDEKGLRDSCWKIANIGYSAIQLAGSELAPETVASAAAENGLKIISAHMKWQDFLGDIEKIIAACNIYKIKHTAIGGLPNEYRSAEGAGRFVEELIPISEKLAAAGMTFSYHNHSHELARYGEKTWLSTIYDLASPAHLKAELDVYWIQHGGGDPVQWICCYSGREPLLHLKDMAITDKREQRFAEIGQGNLNWKAILQAAQESGVEWYIVEQDQCYDRDPFDSLKISYEYLNSMGLS